MIAAVGHFQWIDLLHPLSYWGYQWWSGAGSDLGELTLIFSVLGSMYLLYRHHNCHIDGCKAVGRNDPVVHAPACHKHHSHRELRGKVPTPVDVEEVTTMAKKKEAAAPTVAPAKPKRAPVKRAPAKKKTAPARKR